MKAIIFDLDGVLILSEQMYYDVHSQVCKNHGFELSKEDYIKFYLGRRVVDSSKQFLKAKNADASLSSQMVKEFRAKKKDIFDHKLKQYISLREGVHEMLKKLRKEHKLAIATSSIKVFTDVVIDAFNLRDYFEIIIYGDTVSKGKPDPEIYLTTAKELRIPPKDCIVIEDAENGIESAKNAGMKCIAIEDKSFEADVDFSMADAEIKNFKELTSKFIENLK